MKTETSVMVELRKYENKGKIKIYIKNGKALEVKIINSVEYEAYCKKMGSKIVGYATIN